MKRALLAVVSTCTAVAALLSYKTSPLPEASAAAAVAAGSRTLTGDVASTRWGPVQVAVVLDPAGSITAVQVLQQPSGNHRDLEIGAYSLPRLQAQTVELQSADVDVVSGATYTSQGYITSLQSALDQR